MERKIISVISVLTFLAILPSYISTVPLEAAFQGLCEDGNPCEQSCFNLHDLMYECYCAEGFYLHSNGYNCIAFNSSQPEDDDESKPKISIQIEVDIQPPEDGEGEKLSEEELARLGLPARHIHYTAGQPEEQRQEAELLQPGDIQLTFADSERGAGVVWPSNNLADSSLYDNEVEVPDLEYEELDPPRALPDISLRDNIYSVDAYCGLQCGPGRCRILERGEKRCLCPLGLSGDHCEDSLLASGAPGLTGHSHFTLPTLQNAYSDLHLALDFKPKTLSGVLLITGQTDDMTGDYLALIITDGYVELRLDCGTGPGLVRSSSQVHLNQWNHLSVFRHDWAVWIQLNGGLKEEGRSQGLFSRITFNQALYLGGVGDMKNVKNFLGLDTGLSGCIRRLEINDKVYNLTPESQGGDMMAGQDISNCEDESCLDVSCQHGHCGLHQLAAVCQCSMGFTGSHCETAGDFTVGKFSGHSYIRYPALGDSALLWLSLQLSIKPHTEDGILLYNADRTDGAGDFLSLALADGYVEVVMDDGSGVVRCRGEQRLELGVWHSVEVVRQGGELSLSVDSQPAVTVSQAGHQTLSLQQSLWLGGVQRSSAVDNKQGFKGCMKDLVINSLPMELLASAVVTVNVDSCHPIVGAASEKTSSLQSPAHHPAPALSGQSYLAFNSSNIYTNLIGNSNLFNLRLKMTSSDGLLVWAGGSRLATDSDFLMLEVVQGRVQFSFNLGSGILRLEYNRTRVDDGRWHRIRATRFDRSASLLVDNGQTVTGTAPGVLTQLNTRPILYLGGVPQPVMDATNYRPGMVGCIGEFSVGNVASIDMLNTALTSKNVDICQK